MNAYRPTDLATLWLTLAALAAIVAAGFALSRLRTNGTTRTLAWILVVAAIAGIERLTADQPPGYRMLALILVALLALKPVVSLEAQTERGERLRPLPWLAFACGWLGMRPAVFAAFPGPARSGAFELFRRGTGWLGAGAIAIVAARFCLVSPGVFDGLVIRRILAGMLMLIGLSFVLHFGTINLLAGAWRLAGAETHSLFRAPVYSRSLTEFWGRRWNLAFTELSTIAVYRPLCGLIGQRAAIVAAFLFSGVLHELAISVPVNAGYGLPLAYFTLHAAAMQIEQVCAARGVPVSGWGAAGRLWTAAWLLLPLPLLFHPPFVAGVVLPLIEPITAG